MNKKQLKKYDLLNLLTLCKSEEVAGAGEEESKLDSMNYSVLRFVLVQASSSAARARLLAVNADRSQNLGNLIALGL